MDKRKIIKLLKSYLNFLLESGISIDSAFLFGSYAEKRSNKDSDIDIAIIYNVEGDINSFEETFKLMKFRRNFDLRIEPTSLFQKRFIIQPFCKKNS